MKNKKGMTLIEIIVSLAIIGIIAVIVLSVFTTSFLNIVRAGLRTKAVNEAEEDFAVTPTIISTETKQIELPTKSGVSIIDVTGSYAKGKVEINQGPITGTEVEIEAFVPGLVGSE